MNERELINARSLYDQYSGYISRTSVSKSLFLIAKRTFDVLASLILLLLASPLFIVIGVMIKLDSEGSIFFKHKRIGKDGNIIYLYKFRSMVKNATSLMEKFTPEQKKEFEENYKLSNDPRITKIGNFLRKSSLDELPQLINILKGDMTLIGPRPIVEKELEKYGMYKRKFLSITPGLTGNWACSGRSDISYEDRITLELFYVDHMSIKLDIKIFFKTIISVIKKDGAI